MLRALPIKYIKYIYEWLNQDIINLFPQLSNRWENYVIFCLQLMTKNKNSHLKRQHGSTDVKISLNGQPIKYLVKGVHKNLFKCLHVADLIYFTFSFISVHYLYIYISDLFILKPIF